MTSATVLTGTGPQVIAQALMSSSATQYHALGEKAFSNDGRTFRYALNGAVALAPGNVAQSPAIVANHVNLTPTAVVAVGDRAFSATLGATAATANQYAGGTLVVEIGTTGAGLSYLIDGHAAVASSGVITANLRDAIVTATSGTVTVSLVQNLYSGIIKTPVTTLTGTPVGVAIYPLAIAQYGWICSRGLTGVLADGAITVGTVACAVPSAAAGAAKVMAATLFSIGTFCKTTITTQVTPCYLTLD
jgi:hypothetical protein